MSDDAADQSKAWTLHGIAKMAMQLELATKQLDEAARNFRASMRHHGRADFLELASLAYDNAPGLNTELLDDDDEP